jgi:predicted MFS family arabinose efflux permease
VRPVLLATAVTVLTALPMFLVGAMSVQLRADLDFGPAALGGAIAVFRATGASGGAIAGRITDRIGAAWSMRLSVTITGISGFGIVLFARSWASLAVGLAFAGVAASWAQTAANRYLIRSVRIQRQGLAFGIKQAALPTGSMLAGAAVPALALTFGWRPTFALGAVMALAFLLFGPKPRASVRKAAVRVSATASLGGGWPLLVLAIGLMFGMGAGSSLAAFTVESAVANGVEVGRAGLLLAAGSVVAIVVRITVGRFADTLSGGHLTLVAMLLLTGTLGYVLLSVGGRATFVGVGLAFGAGWGFNGLFWFAVMRLAREAPGATTGTVMAGGMSGGVFGPLVFGFVVEARDFSTAWLIIAAFSVLAALLILLGQRLLGQRARIELH